MNYLETEYVIETVEVHLGILGGLYALLWEALAILLGSYQSFNKNNDLIRKFYSSENIVH
jgi:hypothetical protein